MPKITKRDIIAVGLIICGFMVGVWLAGCQESPEPIVVVEEGVVVGVDEGIFWAYVEPRDTVWFEMRWSWGKIEGCVGTGEVAVEAPFDGLEDIWWKAWSKGYEADSVMLKGK